MIRSAVFFRTITISLLAILTAGCTHPPVPPPVKPVKAALPPAPVVQISAARPGSLAYYYFILAQLRTRAGDGEAALALIDEAIAKAPAATFLQREKAVLLVQQKKYVAARQIADRLLETAPENIDNLMLSGRIRSLQKDYAEAAEIYEKILQLSPENESLYFFLGAYYTDNKDLTNAARIYRRLVAEFPASYMGYFYLGKTQRLAGDFPVAEKLLKKAARFAPQMDLIHSELVQLYEDWGDKTKQISIYRDMLQNAPGNGNAALPLALVYHQRKQLKQRDAVLASYLKAWEDGNEPILQLMKLYVKTQKYPEARILTRAMTGLAPQNTDLFYLAGLIDESLDQPDEAIAAYKQVTAHSENYIDAVGNLLTIYQKQGKIDEGIDFLSTALTEAPENAFLWFFYGSLFEEKKAYDNARQAYEKSIAFSEPRATLHFRLAVVLDQLGDKKDCIEQLETVIEIAPEHANALNYLGYTFAESGEQLERAEQLIEKALKLKPDDGYITDSLGWVYFKQGRYAEALEALKKAAELVDTDPTIYEHIGDVYHKQGNTLKALEYYRLALPRKGKDKTALQEKIDRLSTGQDTLQ